MHRFLGHPISLALFAVVSGLLLHRWLNPWFEPDADPELVTSDISPPTVSPPTISPPTGVPKGADEAVEELELIIEPADEEAGETPPASRELAPSIEDLSTVGFHEIWAYLMSGEEERWDPGAPLTDVGLFTYRLDEIGRLTGRLRAATVEFVRSRGARPHLVVASSGQKTLLHFLLDPRFRQRQKLLGDLVGLANRYDVDGLQLDFESLRSEDSIHFRSFLGELRAALPDRLRFSIAVPARTKHAQADPFAYRRLRDLADRFLIMVYDEHWKGGPPGSVSSRAWHDDVVRHALRELPREKVVVGLPLYGRIWQLDRVARATRHYELRELLAEPGVEVRYDIDSPSYRFERTVRAEGWFDDAASLHAKFEAARKLGSSAVGFWRLGQEDARVWDLLRVER